MQALILYPLLSTALYYLGSRALITEAIWRRYPPELARFADCAACTGFWWGLILALTLGQHEHMDFLSLSHDDLVTPIVVAFCSLVWTPIVAGLMQRGLDFLGVAVTQIED